MNYLNPKLATTIIGDHRHAAEAIMGAAWAIADAAGLDRPLIRITAHWPSRIMTVALTDREKLYTETVDHANDEMGRWQNAIRIATHGSIATADLMEDHA